MVQLHKQFLSCWKRHGFVKILLKYSQLFVSRLDCWEILMEELLAFQRKLKVEKKPNILLLILFMKSNFLHLSMVYKYFVTAQYFINKIESKCKITDNKDTLICMACITQKRKWAHVEFLLIKKILSIRSVFRIKSKRN